MQPQPRYKKGDKIGGRYLVHEALMGGMGEVYLCLDLQNNLPLALKTFQARFLINQKLRQAFESEVATWVALEKHPNIVRCFYLKEIENQPFIFLEWVASDESHGTDLRSWLARGPLDVRLALDFAIDICRGLIHAGQKQPGLVHRDLKPDNILVAQGPVAKVTDFGLAKIVQDVALALPNSSVGPVARQHPSSMGGTPPYMAPEQWRGEALDRRTDIYAVGCILFEMLTGRLPFAAGTLDGLRAQHLQAEVPDLTAAETLPQLMNPLLTGCLAKQKERRFTSADDLLQELSEIYERRLGHAPRPILIGEDFTAVDYNNRGNSYYVLRRYCEAMADYTQALRIDPNDAMVWYNRGNVYRDLQRLDDALADYTQALRIHAEYAPAYCNRGITFHAMGRQDEALADYSQTLTIDPNDAKAYCNRGLTYHALQRYNQAFNDYNQALRIDPNSAAAYHNRADTCIALERIDDALADYTQALRIDPNLAQAYCNRGVAYRALRRYDQALVDFTQALRIGPNNAEAYFNRGNTYADLQQYDKAVSDFTRAMRIDPNNAKVYYNRGNIYLEMRRHAEALADYSQALRMDTSDARVYYNRGNAYAALRRFDEALADYTQALRINPSYAKAYSNRGTAYYDLLRYDEALADYTEALRIDPYNAQAWNGRGATYQALARSDEAIADYTQAVRIDPKFVPPYLNLGILFGRRGDHRKALTYFEKAAQLGDFTGAEYAMQARKMLGIAPATEPEPAQQILKAFFQQAKAKGEMRHAVAKFPSLLDAGFIAALEQDVAERVPPDLKRALEQRLAWLRQIASEQ